MRKPIIVLGLVLALAAVPLVALAANGRGGSALERQVAEWTTKRASTSSTTWRNVPGLGRVGACTLNLVSAVFNVTVSGAPAAFRVVVDTPEAPMRPGPARFVPDGKESFSYTFVGRTFPFEDDDSHVFSVQWRSPSGEPVRLSSGSLVLLFRRGTHNCP